ncbi:MAG: hypothetical protein AAF449_19205, partial [Myxococcota bacterium]
WSIHLQLAVIFCGLIAACELHEQSISIPDDIAYIAVAELDATGNVDRISALDLWKPGVTVVSRGSRLRLLGFTAQQLAAFGVTASDIPREALRVAEDCRTPLLPSPRVQLERADSTEPADSSESVGGAWVPVSQELRLTAPFVEKVCVDLESEDDWGIDETCSGQSFCAARPVAVSRCAVAFDLATCGGGRLEVSIGPDGEVCAETLDRPASCTQRDAPAALTSFTCTGDCSINLYRRARNTERPFSVDYVKYTESPPQTPSFESMTPFVRPESLKRIHGQAMIGVGDRIVVASHHNESGRACEGRPRFVFIDPVRLSTTTVDAPFCTWALAASEGGFFGSHRPDGSDTWMLSRFDAQGRIEATQPLVLDGERQIEWQPSSVTVSPDGSLVTAVLFYDRGSTRFATGLIVANTDSLAVQSSQLVPGPGDTFSTTLLDSGRLLLARTPTADITRIDPRSGAASAETVAQLSSPWLYYLSSLGDGRVGIGLNLGLSVFTLDGSSFNIGHPGRATEQSVINLSPFIEDNIYLAVGTEKNRNGWRAVATLFDAERLRFKPGVWDLGPGIATDIVQRNGKTFVLLPWSNSIAVLQPSATSTNALGTGD